MNFSKTFSASFLILSLWPGCVGLPTQNNKSPVSEGLNSIVVTTVAPIPQEIENVTQAQALAREAAIGLGQREILNYILQKKTKSEKLLSVAEVPSLQLQDEIRGLVQGAIVKKTHWTNDECRVTLEIDKRHLKDILKKN